MTQIEILSEFEKLPIKQQLEVLESALRILRSRLRERELPGEQTARPLPLAEAAQLLLSDYTLDDELTAFTVLDGEPFYA